MAKPRRGDTVELTIDDLVRQGPDPSDARLVLLDLTDEGRAVVEAMKGVGAEVSARTLDPLSPEEAREFKRLLAKLC